MTDTPAPDPIPDPLSGLTPGRVVRYVDGNCHVHVGHVTFVHGADEGHVRGDVNLFVLADNGETFASGWKRGVAYCQAGIEGEPGHESPVYQPFTWHWMFAGQNTRYAPDRVEKK